MKSEKQENLKSKSIDKTLVVVGIIILFVIAVVITTIMTIANPLEIKKQKADGLRINDLSSIRYEIQDYYSKHESLPESLIHEDIYLNEDTRQRMEQWNYEYIVENDNRFKLCTTFETDSKAEGNGRSYYSELEHKAGYDCITFEVRDPEKNPYFEVVVTD